MGRGLAGEDGEAIAPLLEEASAIEDHRGFA
jgi:hypothetical protein